MNQRSLNYMGKLQTPVPPDCSFARRGICIFLDLAGDGCISCEPFEKTRQIMPDLDNGKVGAAGANSGVAAASYCTTVNRLEQLS